MIFKIDVTRSEKQRRKDIMKWKKEGIIFDLGSCGMNNQKYTLHKFLKDNLCVYSTIIGIDVSRSEDVNILVDLNKFPYPFKNESTGMIVAGEIIEHLTEPFQFLNECHRILKKNGRLIVTTPNMTSITYILGILHNKGDYGHCNAWNMELFDALLTRLGKFKILEKKMTDGLVSWNIPIHFFTNIFPVFKTGLFYVLEK